MVPCNQLDVAWFDLLGLNRNLSNGALWQTNATWTNKRHKNNLHSCRGRRRRWGWGCRGFLSRLHCLLWWHCEKGNAGKCCNLHSQLDGETATDCTWVCVWVCVRAITIALNTHMIYVFVCMTYIRYKRMHVRICMHFCKITLIPRWGLALRDQTRIQMWK